jgi:hypothetical protein
MKLIQTLDDSYYGHFNHPIPVDYSFYLNSDRMIYAQLFTVSKGCGRIS